MKVCGVELKGSEAIICLLEQGNGTFSVPDCRQRSFTLSQSTSTEALRDWHFAFEKLMQDYHVDEIAIIQRDQKGKFAGSPNSFKLEAAIQLLKLPVSILSPSIIKEQLKLNKIPVEFSSLGLKTFQQAAFKVAYAHVYHRIVE